MKIGDKILNAIDFFGEYVAFPGGGYKKELYQRIGAVALSAFLAISIIWAIVATFLPIPFYTITQYGFIAPLSERIYAAITYVLIGTYTATLLKYVHDVIKSTEKSPKET